jgi:hypothetical protein
MKVIMGSLQRFKCLTILFVTNVEEENVSSYQVLAEELREGGHRVVFAFDI